MNHPSTPPRRHNTHPLVLVAAVVFILFCGVGIASFMGWLPSIANNGRPEQLVTPADNQQATAPVVPPTSATQSSQYAAGAGSINGVPTKPDAGGVVAAPVVQPSPERVAAPVRDPALQRERERERAHEKAVDRQHAAAPVCDNCGMVEEVNESTTRAAGSGVGAAGGAVVGGLLGRQVGDGRGRDLATIAGAIGGAVVGNQVEGKVKSTRQYDVKVRMHDGEIRTYHTDSPVWRRGDQVKVVEGMLQGR